MDNPRALLEGLLKIYSPSFQEHDAVEYLVGQMGGAGLRAFRDDAGNAVGIVGEGPQEIVMLGHIDTHPGFVEVRREGDMLYGRGSVDAKGPLCTFASAAARVGAREGWRIVVVGAVEEECSTSKGAHFAKTQYKPAYAIVGEPSGWDRVTLGYKGSLWIEYQLTRNNAHSAGQARSANEDAVEFWIRVKQYAEQFNQGKQKVFDRLDPTLRGMKSENDGLHETARLTIGLRLPLEITVDALESALLDMAGDGKLEFDTETPAYRVEKNNTLVRAFLGAMRERGATPGFTLKTGTSDMNVVGPHWNCPIVTYGPGDSNLDHTPNEHIDLKEYDNAVDVLTRVLETLTQQEAQCANKMDNLILDTDSYKASHFLQFPTGTTAMFSYVESRGGRYDRTVFFGLQYILKRYFTQRVTMEMVNEADAFFRLHGEPFPREGWEYIAREREGKLPLKIRAVPEGTVVPTHNALITVESTDPHVFWVVGWLETQLMRIWYPITVATQSYMIKQDILAALDKSADDPRGEIGFKLHDFGARGVSSRESAEIGGASHLVNFMGSDTVVGAWCANHYYHSEMAAFSIPAAEHATITAWGKEHEVDAFHNILNQFAKPGALVAGVSDSYDLDNAVRNLWGKALREQVIASGATLVVRPDSGDPPTIVRRTLEQLDAAYGHTLNSKGYKVLNHVRVIQGDGINQESIRAILNLTLEGGYSATNITFGMGGALLQQLNRDTQQFAMKCSEVVVNGTRVGVYKDPVTDHAKKSKAGRLDLIETAQGYATVVLNGDAPAKDSVMRTVFENGELLVDDTLDEIRQRAKQAQYVPLIGQ